MIKNEIRYSIGRLSGRSAGYWRIQSLVEFGHLSDPARNGGGGGLNPVRIWIIKTSHTIQNYFTINWSEIGSWFTKIISALKGPKLTDYKPQGLFGIWMSENKWSGARKSQPPEIEYYCELYLNQLMEEIWQDLDSEVITQPEYGPPLRSRIAGFKKTITEGSVTEDKLSDRIDLFTEYPKFEKKMEHCEHEFHAVDENPGMQNIGPSVAECIWCGYRPAEGYHEHNWIHHSWNDDQGCWNWKCVNSGIIKSSKDMLKDG